MFARWSHLSSLFLFPTIGSICTCSLLPIAHATFFHFFTTLECSSCTIYFGGDVTSPVSAWLWVFDTPDHEQLPGTRLKLLVWKMDSMLCASCVIYPLSPSFNLSCGVVSPILIPSRVSALEPTRSQSP